jgi:hypothetical protein
MFGENLKPIARECATCHKQVTMRLDPDDARRHADGMFVQDAFADRAGKPYLTPAEAEMWISGVCGPCWDLLCPADPVAYS